ncbi:MAG: hypothetical protein Q9219_001765 [cf. Caloplaca sp. 3 TL-2023]
MPPTTLHFITGNENKLAEVQAILGDVVPLKSWSLDLVEIQGTIEEICKDKCRRAAAIGLTCTQAACPTFMILILILIWHVRKPFFQALGHTGLNKLLAAYEDKSAQAICTFAYSEGPGQEPLIFEGCVPGKIVPPRGPLRFGWDPIFEYLGETFAEMDQAKKNGLSHRFLALAKLKDWLGSRS